MSSDLHIPAVRLFLEVADSGSLSKVAARRQTAQSHISRQISEFETHLGGRLFVRTGRGVKLTDMGERVALRLRQWLVETEHITHELKAASGKVQGEVRLGIIPSAAHPLMTRIYAALQAQHPDIRLNIAEAQGTELDAMLDNGDVDLAILFRFRKPSGREEKLLSVAHTYLVSAPGDALTASASVHFSRLAGLPLVLPRRPSQWRSALDDSARSLGFALQQVVEVDSLTMQKELVASTPGLYAILGPYSFATELQTGRLQASRLTRPDLVRHVTLALPRQGKLSPACKLVADMIQQQVKRWNNELVPRG
jgi:LysR family nitrogen assimilation transcriptional regulator